jgi:hypothetical protein
LGKRGIFMMKSTFELPITMIFLLMKPPHVDASV